MEVVMLKNQSLLKRVESLLKSVENLLKNQSLLKRVESLIKRNKVNYIIFNTITVYIIKFIFKLYCNISIERLFLLLGLYFRVLCLALIGRFLLINVCFDDFRFLPSFI